MVKAHSVIITAQVDMIFIERIMELQPSKKMMMMMMMMTPLERENFLFETKIKPP